jgi:hypothetical protein
MRAKLADEYNQVVRMALPVVRRSESPDPATHASAEHELQTRFPHLRRLFTVNGPRWFIIHQADNIPVPLRPITAAQVVGLRDPDNLTRLNVVRRPAEARP